MRAWESEKDVLLVLEGLLGLERLHIIHLIMLRKVTFYRH